MAEVFNLSGSFVLSFLLCARLAQAWQGGGIFALLLAVQAGMAACLLVFHKRTDNPAPWTRHALAWLCALLPLALRVRGTAWPSVPGLLIALWALWALGDSFSVAPEDRGLVRRGPYRFVRHPMYAGEILACLGAVMVSRSVWNGLVLCALCALLFVRVAWEERALEGYDAYANGVRWKLVPGVW